MEVKYGSHIGLRAEILLVISGAKESKQGYTVRAERRLYYIGYILLTCLIIKILKILPAASDRVLKDRNPCGLRCPRARPSRRGRGTQYQ